jgi:uncharacterized protein YjbJ (UPF0337 family)
VKSGASDAQSRDELSESREEPSTQPGVYNGNTGVQAPTIGGFEMNWEQVEGKWDQFKGTVKEKWGKLTDDDLTMVRGRRDNLVGRLKERYGLEKEAAEKEVDAWVSGLH